MRIRLFVLLICFSLCSTKCFSQGVWTGHASGYVVEPNLPTCDIVKNGIIYLSPTQTSLFGYWVSYSFQYPFCLSGDSATVEMCFRIGQSDAYDPTINIVGTKSTAWVGIMGSLWAQPYASIGAGTTRDTNIAQLVQTLKPSGWDTMKLKVQNGQLTAFFNNAQVYQVNYAGSVGSIKEILIWFKGSGALDWVKFYNSNSNALVYREDFDTCTSFVQPPGGYILSNPQTICGGGTYIYNGHSYASTGTYYDSLKTISGCDSIIVTQLTVNPADSINNPQTICYGDMYSFNGHSYYSPGNYYDTLSSMSGCDSVIVTRLIVNPIPPTPVITIKNDTLVCSYDPSYKSYQWYDDTALVEGATNPYFIFSEGGNYNIQVTDTNGCSIAVGINLTSTSRFFSGNVFFLYPNPAANLITIKHEELTIDTVKIYNAQGQNALSIYPQNRKENDKIIDISTFSNGIYFIRIFSERGEWRSKFLKSND